MLIYRFLMYLFLYILKEIYTPLRRWRERWRTSLLPSIKLWQEKHKSVQPLTPSIGRHKFKISENRKEEKRKHLVFILVNLF